MWCGCLCMAVCWVATAVVGLFGCLHVWTHYSCFSAMMCYICLSGFITVFDGFVWLCVVACPVGLDVSAAVSGCLFPPGLVHLWVGSGFFPPLGHFCCLVVRARLCAEGPCGIWVSCFACGNVCTVVACNTPIYRTAIVPVAAVRSAYISTTIKTNTYRIDV